MNAAKRIARRGLRASRRVLRRAVGRAYTRWRRSIQVRVVTSTLVISAVVVAILGAFLQQQISAALMESKIKAAMLQLDEGLGRVQRDLGGPSSDDDGRLDSVVNALKARSGPSGLYEIYIRDAKNPYYDGFATNELRQESVPQRLREELRRGPSGARVYTFGKLSYIGRDREPGLIVGGKTGQFELYYLFPLTQEERTLTRVAWSLLAVGAVLVLLLAAIASLVTRQVVIPVRLAAQGAQRLAAGRLEERMRVRGEDDLARLATSFNEMAANLQEKIGELENLSQVQRQFVSDVSHELRTPLTTIRIAADMIYEHRDTFDPAVARSAELLQSQLERFESLLTDLLEISRYDAGAATLDAESLDMRDLVLRAVGDIQGLAERTGSKVVLQLPGEPCMAEVDRRRVERILRNLLVNAVEHGEGEDIVVTVAADRDAVAVAVRDHGVGLKPGESQMVFDRFWRADPARARTTGGTGLGLAISKEDAQLHGGWLQAWGEPGKGSQFRLSLPRVAGAELRGSPLPLVPPGVRDSRAVFAELEAGE
ncbi:two-component sensor histidine kinase [Actinomadura rubrobrunea]|uniref:Sensor histidine kinase MtrB n=1 Tax=Actinomadura rubrobrunea TaxID=115335 RepID=A0A9W6PS08_9ACTN|nr:MtrAB system histidine kinase MtrB [Actinomadura rubrobrunea]GLW61827.1 two-component sensor histidine kinase [Actinomadura rubrobrunea]